MKRALYALLIAVMLLTLAVPVMAKWEWNADTVAEFEEDYPLLLLPKDGIYPLEENNLGCSAGYFGNGGKGIIKEANTARENFDLFGDELTYDQISTVEGLYQDAIEAGEKPDKRLVEYLKLWNKGYLDGDYNVVKTCPYKKPPNPNKPPK